MKRWKCLVPPGVTVWHCFIEGAHPDDGNDTMAETKGQWQYHQGTIKWYLSSVCGQEEKYIDATVVHELVHVLLDPLQALIPGRKADEIVNEHTTEAVARAIQRARKAGTWD